MSLPRLCVEVLTSRTSQGTLFGNRAVAAVLSQGAVVWGRMGADPI